ncbi:MAG: amidase [Sandaracinaceae bacterium]|nr:amidase [Sandaracinaceae bacterium]
MHDDLNTMDAVAIAERIRDGALSAEEATRAAIARIEQLDPEIGAIAHRDFERALERARGRLTGPLAGVPFLLKDLLPYPGQPCAMGSRLFAAHAPEVAPPLAQAYDAAGLVTLGRTTSSELGLLGSTESLLNGRTHNPWDLQRSATGSSGGAAAAVASGMVPLAHASDGGGSIRIPAAMCGLFGFKPSRGRMRANGQEDPIGLVAEHCVSVSVRDSATLLSVSEVLEHPDGPVGLVTGPNPRRLRIGVYARTLMGEAPDDEVAVALAEAVALCEALGHRVEPCDGPTLVSGAAVSSAFFTLAGAGIAQIAAAVKPVLGREPGPDELEPFTLALLARFRAAPEGAMERALSAIAENGAAMRGFLERYDVVLCPTTPLTAPPLGFLDPRLPADTLLARTERLAGYTAIHNMAGVPAMSVPLGQTPAGLPIGIQFAAPAGADALLLALAFELEHAAPWAHRRAPHAWRAAADAETHAPVVGPSAATR